MEFVDVFISHNQQDQLRCEMLRQMIEMWGFSCYVDFTDPANARAPNAEDLAMGIREKLRASRCLIYAYSAQSQHSKWMPWEIGFYDGRWGKHKIVLFDLDHLSQYSDPAAVGTTRASTIDMFTVQEFLSMYRSVSVNELQELLVDLASQRTLVDRADVDLDRLTSLMSGAIQNPIGFYIGCFQYAVALHSQMFGVRSASAQIVDETFKQLRAAADVFTLPKGVGGHFTDQSLFSSRAVSERAMNATR